MSDQTCLTVLCGGCCVALFSAFQPWCNSKRYGCNACSCGGPRGCCYSCFEEGFNNDAWDEENGQPAVKAGQGRKTDTNGTRGDVAEQPAAVSAMNPEKPSAPADTTATEAHA
ncbi:hypothetical protein JB92DRAFT_2846535 [Gautieria morchelliformis]|nr:hypothetical protein JB92DRAFT_2846535 [Gautieria morchelliformis]